MSGLSVCIFLNNNMGEKCIRNEWTAMTSKNVCVRFLFVNAIIVSSNAFPLISVIICMGPFKYFFFFVADDPLCFAICTPACAVEWLHPGWKPKPSDSSIWICICPMNTQFFDHNAEAISIYSLQLKCICQNSVEHFSCASILPTANDNINCDANILCTQMWDNKHLVFSIRLFSREKSLQEWRQARWREKKTPTDGSVANKPKCVGIFTRYSHFSLFSSCPSMQYDFRLYSSDIIYEKEKKKK